MPPEDYYALLEIPRVADGDAVRRAFHRLARLHHPDVAGPAATMQFQRLARAYDVLSDPDARARYDAHLRAAESPATGAPAAAEWAEPKPRRFGGEGPPTAGVIERLSGSLDLLVEKAVAHKQPNGVIELRLTRDEAQEGGTAAIDATVVIPCPTCGGLAEPNAFWCVRCEYDGTVREEITVCIPIPALARDGASFAVSVDRHDRVPPLRVRLRV